nr:fatty acyl-CoA reductase wat-like [Onthophagus taurus]
MSGIRDFYKNRSILITGGTGFMGKVLIEKILTSIPDVGTIFVLVRPKKGLSPQERIEAMLKKEPFTFNDIAPNQFKKIIAIEADTSVENLGLNNTDRETIKNQVSVVMHFAASIRFDLPLLEAMKQNVLSLFNILNLCKEIKNIVSIIHLSTTFCNIDVECMEEKVYDFDNVDSPLETVKIVKMFSEKFKNDEVLLKKIEKSFIKPHPNTYTYTKRLAEIVARDMGNDLPIIIARPSIVLPSYKLPTPGWVDNLNGPMGILTAAGKGVLRVLYANVDTYPQLIPVDVAINGTLAIGWLRAKQKFEETPVYNITQGDLYKITWREISEKARVLAIKYPYKRFLWYPSGFATSSFWLYTILSFFLHTIPAYFVDFLLVMFFQKPFLVNIQQRLSLGMDLIAYFTLKNFKFLNEKVQKLHLVLSEEEQDIFYMSNKEYNIDEYITKCFFGSRKYSLKNEDTNDLLKSRIILNICYIIDICIKIFFVYIGFKLIQTLLSGYK